jgi:hypothetical protein
MTIFYRKIGLAIVASSYLAAAGAGECVLPSQVVPFPAVYGSLILNPGCTVSANYNFGNYQIVFCFSNNVANKETGIGRISWPYQGVVQFSTLPIFLKTHASVQGSFADPAGTLTIQNTESVPLLISCLFG